MVVPTVTLEEIKMSELPIWVVIYHDRHDNNSVMLIRSLEVPDMDLVAGQLIDDFEEDSEYLELDGPYFELGDKANFDVLDPNGARGSTKVKDTDDEDHCSECGDELMNSDPGHICKSCWEDYLERQERADLKGQDALGSSEGTPSTP